MHWLEIGGFVLVGISIPFAVMYGKSLYDTWSYRRRYKKKLPHGVTNATLECRWGDIEYGGPWYFTAQVPEQLFKRDSPMIDISGDGRSIEDALEHAAHGYYFELEMRKKGK